MERTAKLLAAAALAMAWGAAPLCAAEAPPRRVLIISSFGSRFAPFDVFASVLRTEIARGWEGPVEFLETPLELARYEGTAEEGSFAEYVASLASRGRLDLLVTVGAPAAGFVARHRSGVFESVPTLVTGLERRQARDLPPLPNRLVSAVVLDAPAVIENILRLLPDTKQIAVVLGDSPLERYWRGELQKDFAPFAGRVAFRWFDGLSLEAMRREAAALPPGSAILYGILNVDAAGVPHEEDEGLEVLRAAAAVPLFGAFEAQLGRGIVGGPLLSSAEDARHTAALALRMLKGDPIAGIGVPPPAPPAYVYDARELSRFRIPESRLPAGSVVRHRPPSLWEAYRRPVLAAAGVVALQALLIAALLAQRARRRRAEELVHALNRRLVTAQEDERKLIARELHDDLSQRLARLAIDAARLEYAAAVPLEGRPQPAMRDELARLSDDVHALAYQLHPSTLDDLGLTDALRVECERFSRLESIPVEHDLAAPAETSRETALCLFRIAQEALRNVARHARAKTVSLSCRASDHGVRIVLADDGVGFDPQRGRGRPSLGLASMRERVEILGGRFDLESAPGRGTTVSAWAPLEPRVQ